MHAPCHHTSPSLLMLNPLKPKSTRSNRKKGNELLGTNRENRPCEPDLGRRQRCNCLHSGGYLFWFRATHRHATGNDECLARAMIAEKTQFASRRDTSSRPLPANSFIRSSAFGPPRFVKMNEVNHNLIGTKMLGNLILTRRFVAENHHFGIP